MLRAARRYADLSQRELAEMAGTSRQAVERAEGPDAPGLRVGTLTRLLAAPAVSGSRRSPQKLRLGVVEAEGLRDRGGRHFPAHLDVRRPGRMGEWWGDWPYSVWLIPQLAPRQRPDHTFDRARWRRDQRRHDLGQHNGAMPSMSPVPDLETFRALARGRRVIPVTRRLLADGETPVGVYRKLAGDRPGHVPARVRRARAASWSRYSFVGVRCTRR